MNIRRFITMIVSLLFAVNSGILHAQNLVSLDEAIRIGASEVETRLAQGAKVVVLNFRSPSQRLSEYVLDEMTIELFRNGRLTVVDRAHLDLVRQELNLHVSGEISDASAQSIGQLLGAQSIISGSLDNMGAHYRVRFRTIAVETAAIQVMSSINVRRDNLTINLLGTTDRASIRAARQAEPTRQPSQPVRLTEQQRRRRTIALLSVLGAIVVGGIIIGITNITNSYSY